MSEDRSYLVFEGIKLPMPKDVSDYIVNRILSSFSKEELAHFLDVARNLKPTKPAVSDE
jgi:hypothetical protein